MCALPVELTLASFAESSPYHLDDQLTNCHAGTQFDWQWAVIDQFKLDRSRKPGMNGGRGDVYPQAKSGDAAFAFNTSGYSSFEIQIDPFLGPAKNKHATRQFPSLFGNNHRVGRAANKLGGFVAGRAGIKNKSRHIRSRYPNKRIKRKIDGSRIVCVGWRIRLDRDQPLFQKLLNLQIGQDHAVLRPLFSGINSSFLTQTRLIPLTVG